MDKIEFIRTYVQEQPPRITVSVDWCGFLSDQNISLRETTLPLAKTATLYAPWYHKGGVFESRIEAVLCDPAYSPVRLGEVSQYPHRLKQVTERVHCRPSELIPFPVATDIGVGKTLVLDGNNTLVFMLQHPAWMNERIRLVEIRGASLERWFIDFQVIRDR
ncbi:MAG: hypothetical protein HY683_05775 [Chloroflexi bacterium]|nr:hypothetical protein [Chloroflexota bacterium]